MNKKLRTAFFALTLVGAAFTAQAQVGLIMAGINLGRMAARNKAADAATDKAVPTVEYRNQSFHTKRTVPEILTGEATDQILFLEGQLDLCKAALLADSTGAVCPATRYNTIRTMQVEIAKAQSSWPQRYYKEELAFYVAEDARRQNKVAARANAAK